MPIKDNYKDKKWRRKNQHLKSKTVTREKRSRG